MGDEYDAGAAAGGGESSTSGMWDRMASFVNDLISGSNGKGVREYPEGDYAGAMTRLSADSLLEKAPGLSPRDSAIAARGDMGSAIEEKLAGGADMATGRKFNEDLASTTERTKKEPEKPKMPSKSPDLLPIPQVDPGAKGTIDTTPAPQPSVTKSPSVFRVTPEQSKALTALYGNNTAGMNDHILYKIATGDHSLGPYTPEQLVAYRERGAKLASGQQYPDQQRGTFASILGAAMKG